MKLLSSVNLNVKFYILANAFYYSGYSVINAFLSLFVTSQISGGRIDMVAYAISFYMIIRAVFEIPLSRLTRNLSFIKKRNIIAISYILYGILLFLLGHSFAMWQVFAIQFVLGLLDAIAYPLKWGMFTRIVDIGNEELEWGLEDITSSLLPAVFTAFAGIMSSQFGLEFTFLLFAILLIASGFFFFLMKQSVHRQMEGVISKKQKEVLFY